MISLKVSGTMRDIANSAWISTTDEIKTKSRTYEDVKRVVSFLASNMHTSPFECVTLTFEFPMSEIVKDHTIEIYMQNKFSRISRDKEKNTIKLTTDLLNFAKDSHKTKLKSSLFFKLEEENHELADVLAFGFDFREPYNPSENVEEKIENLNMKVELVSVHDDSQDAHTRVTWRVRCPLSIAVQILRHRTGSFNMVSGRYKTIKQDMISVPNDITSILEAADSKEKNALGELIDEMVYKMDSSKQSYLKMMKELKRCKTKKFLSNSDYKRMREYVRFILPEGRMTELYITFYMPDFKNFLMLRNSDHAQIEHIWIAQEMEKVLNNYKNQ